MHYGAPARARRHIDRNGVDREALAELDTMLENWRGSAPAGPPDPPLADSRPHALGRFIAVLPVDAGRGGRRPQPTCASNAQASVLRPSSNTTRSRFCEAREN